MIENYHTHTFRCGHAKGTEREYIENAIKRGLKVLGFADHAPQLFEGDFVSKMRMRPGQLEDYVATLRALREEYRGQIDILIGLEMEYYPAIFERTLAWLRESGVEYLIHGQHYLNTEKGEIHAFKASDDEARLAQYVDRSLTALRMGIFSYAAHPDAYLFTGDEAVYRRYMEYYCGEVKKLGLPLEINLLGLGTGRHYPTERFFRIAAEADCPVVIGMDAHQPEAILDLETEERALDFCRTLGLRVVEHPEIRRL